ncbi:MAG TPA: transposase [Thermoanaerobaculia bacterium]
MCPSRSTRGRHRRERPAVFRRGALPAHRWCVMPNHVHVLIETFEGFGLPALLYSWKSYTAKEINKLLGTRGQFWFDEYRDRFIRDERHFHTSVAYIENNPVKAGLCQVPEEWVFSSSGYREQRGRDARAPR